MTMISKPSSSSFSSERTTSPGVNLKASPVIMDPISFTTEVEVSSSILVLTGATTSGQVDADLDIATPVVGMSNRTGNGSDEQKSRRLSEVSTRSGVEATTNPSAIVIIQDSEDNIEGVSLPVEEKNLAVQDGSQKIPFVNDADDMQREEKKRIAAKAKVDLEARRISTFWIGGTCEVLPSDAPAAQSLGVAPHASLPVSSNSPVVPSSSVAKATNVDEKQKLEEEIKSRDANLEAASTKVTYL
ncbi:hypothetical protein AALP_AA3G291200 [Arabis alpina]|uniref:Uncharacterized protein n=1 Tax=Arabis alpina TaxID=50452 RepID=A0A087HCF7_ARAAL|nr:hypothetical protein AALP_AA3G291200 [Arabis alpina]